MAIRGKHWVAAAALLCSSSAFAQASWTISETSGQVNVVRTGVSKVAARGGTLSSGDIVSTAAGSRAVLVRGEEYLVVSPNSRLRIAAPEKDGVVTQIIEEAGTVLFKIKKKLTPHFGVQTPYLAAVVKGTTFSVTVSDKGASVQVVEGAVEVSTRDGGARDLVLPGIVAHVSKGDRYRLTVEGSTAKTIDSPVRGTKGAPQPDADEPAVVAESDTTITAEVTEDVRSLDQITGGLVGGSTAPVRSNGLVMASTDMARTPVPTPTPDLSSPVDDGGLTALPPVEGEPDNGSGNEDNGNGNGNAGDGNNGNGNGNAGNGNSGSGNGNAGNGNNGNGSGRGWWAWLRDRFGNGGNNGGSGNGSGGNGNGNGRGN